MFTNKLKALFELKNEEYRDGIQYKEQGDKTGMIYVHVMQSDDSNSQALLVYHKPHNQPYIVTTSLHSDLCKVNDIVLVSISVKGVIQHGKGKYESLMPGTAIVHS